MGEYVNYHEWPSEVDERVELHRCPVADCQSGLVQLVEAEKVDETHWAGYCRCPNCEWTGEGVHSLETTRAFDRVENAGHRAVIRAIKRLTESEIEGAEDYLQVHLDALLNNQPLPQEEYSVSNW